MKKILVAVSAFALTVGCSTQSTPAHVVGVHRPTAPPVATATATPTTSPAAVVPPSTLANDGDKLTKTGCGIERWDIKTLKDPAAKQINFKPKMSTIAALRALTAPSQPTTRVADEQNTYTVSATVTSFKQEADSDIHLAVKDDTGNTMIFEMPAKQCLDATKTPPALITQMNNALRAWSAKYTASGQYQTVNQKVTVTGVLFFDRIHGQRGVAPNGVELHPLLSLTLG